MKISPKKRRNIFRKYELVAKQLHNLIQRKKVYKGIARSYKQKQIERDIQNKRDEFKTYMQKLNEETKETSRKYLIEDIEYDIPYLLGETDDKNKTRK